MKGLIVCLVTLLLASCYQSAEVVEYRQVSVTPVVATGVVSSCYYGTCGNGAYINNVFGATSNYYDYNYDYYDAPTDVTTTSVVYY